MIDGRLVLWKIIFLLVLMTGAMAIIGVKAADTTSESSCVNCHTDENQLKRNLSPVVSKKSSMTSGAG